MEQNREFIDNAKMEQLTQEEMEAVAGGVSIEIRGVERTDIRKGHYAADYITLEKLKNELNEKRLKDVEHFLNTGEVKLTP